MADEFQLHLERLALSGDWDCLQPYLETVRLAGRQEGELKVGLMKVRLDSGCCVACGRRPCGSCGKKNPMWCEVCWDLIRKNCPPGKAVSGLAQVMQIMTRDQPLKPDKGRCV